MRAWKAHHRRLCKTFPSFLASHSYQLLSAPGRAHSLLLAHLLAEHSQALWSAFSTQKLPSDNLSDPIAVLLSLLPRSKTEPRPNLPHLDSIPDSLITFLSCRFSNNNFTIHSSRMDVFAHGIFPLASRSFNHSCIPSAVPVYTLSQNSALVKMNIQLIRDLKPGEEVRQSVSCVVNIFNLLLVKCKITIPYIDPALPYTSRQGNLNLTYNFICSCPLCQRPWLTTHNCAVPSSGLADFETRLREGVLPFLLEDDTRVDSAKLREDFFSRIPPFLSSISGESLQPDLPRWSVQHRSPKRSNITGFVLSGLPSALSHHRPVPIFI